ncbi:cation:proton antiporter [Candidatus Gracilibacteria bacterium]|nr:cation:proton antiporter [Candidatus Gracilibacteria bacterium]
MSLIFTLFLLLGISALFVFVIQKLNFSGVVGLILGGLFFGIPMIKNSVVEPHTEFVFFLGDIGLLCLMFLAGFESSWHKIYHEKKDSLAISSFAAITPFVLCFIIFKALGFSTMVAVVIGISMSITAEATIAEILLNMNKLKTKVGSAMMGAGIIDDIFGFLAFMILAHLFGGMAPKEYLFLLAVIVIFFLGICVRTYLHKKHPFIKVLEKILMWLIVPFFFISIGLNFDLLTLVVNPLTLLLILAVALLGKIGGTLLAKPCTDLNWKQLFLIGWAMNSRGALEMALVLIAFRVGLLSTEIYSALIIMALVTTLMFPLVINQMIRKNPKIMNG